MVHTGEYYKGYRHYRYEYAVEKALWWYEHELRIIKESKHVQGYGEALEYGESMLGTRFVARMCVKGKTMFTRDDEVAALGFALERTIG